MLRQTGLSMSTWLHSRIRDKRPVLLVVENAEAMLVGEGASWQVAVLGNHAPFAAQ